MIKFFPLQECQDILKFLVISSTNFWSHDIYIGVPDDLASAILGENIFTPIGTFECELMCNSWYPPIFVSIITLF
jgi:hypothetical protein